MWLLTNIVQTLYSEKVFFFFSPNFVFVQSDRFVLIFMRIALNLGKIKPIQTKILVQQHS